METNHMQSAVAIFIAVFILCMAFVLIGYAIAEEPTSTPEPEEDGIIFYVVADVLNCRMAPDKHSYVATVLEQGQSVHGTGRWSKDHKWVEIDHSEYGLLWCDYHYLTERRDAFEVETLWDSPIKIRKQAYKGSVTGYLKKGKTVKIVQVVLGWGRCKQGWIDLEYCIEIEGD